MRSLYTWVAIAIANWYYPRRIWIFCIVSPIIMIVLGVTGACYGKWIVDDLRIAQIITAVQYKPTASIELRKTDKLFQDRFVAAYPPYRLN
jgi:hypothetical protein